MAQRLIEAAQTGNIDELNDLIGSNRLILEEMALEGAGHTPLHVACVAGHLGFVQELLKLKPKFAEKVNADGFSPLHIAAARGDVEIAGELLRGNDKLCLVKGKERRIPLHCAVLNGEIHVMKLLLCAWPDSVEETTAQEETVLHLAVKTNRFHALTELVEHLKQWKKEQVINWRDHKGNTALHLAAAGKNFEVVNFMLRGHALEYEIVQVNASNESGLTPLDVLTLSPMGAKHREITEILVRAGATGRSNTLASSLVSVDEDNIQEACSHQSDGKRGRIAHQSSSSLASKNSEKKIESISDIRNALLVVAALIASATYQSVLQPPSIIEVDKADDDSEFRKIASVYFSYGAGLVYILFLGGNTFGFLLSVQMIISLTKELPVRLPLILSLIAMVLTYYCFTLSLLITSTSGQGMTMLHLTPIILSVFLLLTQKWLAMVINFFLKRLFKFNLFGNMYLLGSGGHKELNRCSK